MEIVQEDYFEEISVESVCDIVLLPRSIKNEENNIYNSTTSAVLKLLNQNGLKTDLYNKNELKFQENRSFEWFGPTLFVTAMAISQNPNLVSIALGIISNYLTDVLKGSSGENKISLTIIRENPDKTKTKIKYSGDKDGLKELAKIVKSTK